MLAESQTLSDEQLGPCATRSSSSGGKKEPRCPVSIMYIKGRAGRVQPLPEVTAVFVFAAGLMYIALWSADACTVEPVRPRRCDPLGRLREGCNTFICTAAYCSSDNPTLPSQPTPDAIECCHTLGCNSSGYVVVGWKHTQTHTSAKRFLNVIVSLIQHDIHDWNLSQPQWAACCCIHKKFVSPRMLWIY